MLGFHTDTAVWGRPVSMTSLTQTFPRCGQITGGLRDLCTSGLLGLPAVPLPTPQFTGTVAPMEGATTKPKPELNSFHLPSL